MNPDPSPQAQAEVDRLVEGGRSGNTAALGELYERFFDEVYAYVRFILKDPHEAEDVTHNAFVKAFTGLEGYERRPGKPFAAWLFRIVRNEALMYLRRAGRVDVESPQTVERRRDHASVVTPSLIQGLQDSEVALLLERLPQHQKQAIFLAHVMGFTSEEIAVIMDRTPVAVRKLRHRGLRFLEQRLETVGERLARRGGRRERSPMLVRLRRIPVVRARRYSLAAPVPPTHRHAASRRTWS